VKSPGQQFESFQLQSRSAATITEFAGSSDDVALRSATQ